MKWNLHAITKCKSHWQFQLFFRIADVQKQNERRETTIESRTMTSILWSTYTAFGSLLFEILKTAHDSFSVCVFVLCASNSNNNNTNAKHVAESIHLIFDFIFHCQRLNLRWWCIQSSSILIFSNNFVFFFFNFSLRFSFLFNNNRFVNQVNRKTPNANMLLCVQQWWHLFNIYYIGVVYL